MPKPDITSYSDFNFFKTRFLIKEKKGFIFRTGCKEYLEYEKDESRLNSNKRKRRR